MNSSCFVVRPDIPFYEERRTYIGNLALMEFSVGHWTHGCFRCDVPSSREGQVLSRLTGRMSRKPFPRFICLFACLFNAATMSVECIPLRATRTSSQMRRIQRKKEKQRKRARDIEKQGRKGMTNKERVHVKGRKETPPVQTQKKNESKRQAGGRPAPRLTSYLTRRVDRRARALYPPF